MFLYSKPRAIPLELCNTFIDTFEKSDLKQPGVVYGKNGLQPDSSVKSSTDITFTPNMENDPEWGPLLRNVVPLITKSVEDYKVRFYTAFSTLDPSSLSATFNMQKYGPSEAFHSYHCERGGLSYANRVLVWMVYLNTVTDRGETHFFYQNHYEVPEAGKIVVWPSDWTYLHRGVASPTQTKYILTGWFTHL